VEGYTTLRLRECEMKETLACGVAALDANARQSLDDMYERTTRTTRTSRKIWGSIVGRPMSASRSRYQGFDTESWFWNRSSDLSDSRFHSAVWTG
jgi:hypothetical protein